MSLKWNVKSKHDNEGVRTSGEVVEWLVEHAGDGMEDPVQAKFEKLAAVLGAVLNALPEHSQRAVIEQVDDFRFFYEATPAPAPVSRPRM